MFNSASCRYVSDFIVPSAIENEHVFTSIGEQLCNIYKFQTLKLIDRYIELTNYHL